MTYALDATALVGNTPLVRINRVTDGAPATVLAKVEAFERSLIAAELERPHNSLRSVAEALGIPRKTLHDKLRKHGLPFNTPGENPPDDSE